MATPIPLESAVIHRVIHTLWVSLKVIFTGHAAHSLTAVNLEIFLDSE